MHTPTTLERHPCAMQYLNHSGRANIGDHAIHRYASNGKNSKNSPRNDIGLPHEMLIIQRGDENCTLHLANIDGKTYFFLFLSNIYVNIVAI